MGKHLEKIYREEFIRQKARHDYEKILKDKEAKANSSKTLVQKLTEVSISIFWGILGFYLLYKINEIFM
ncbi:MAG: hypothetical protein GXY91_08265 [Clostridia bacterium]|nr:hypothetical protein [Clostridia bacterium]